MNNIIPLMMPATPLQHIDASVTEVMTSGPSCTQGQGGQGIIDMMGHSVLHHDIYNYVGTVAQPVWLHNRGVSFCNKKQNINC
mmetsp:Transcript_47249/g.84547  ORF Transcript_47249/g.84547 Transcript_47249/m.84547 type:complete len:83 (+) Transcript_47249:976-1224(+)